MATKQQRNALRAAHTKSARRKAGASIGKLGNMRKALAKKFGESPRSFMRANLLGTVQRLNIPLSEIPVGMFAPFTPKERAALIAKRANGKGNGHDHGVGIPLAAIPERAARKTYGSGDKAKRGAHPNAELIAKVIDLLATPDLDKHSSKRLLVALDKLLGA